MLPHWNPLRYSHLRFHLVIFVFCVQMALGLTFALNSVLVFSGYIAIGLIYLLFVPLFLYFWMNNRWNAMGKYERLGVYGLVFLFFPGMILFAPFLNLRLKSPSDS